MMLLFPRDTSFSIEFSPAINAREQKEITPLYSIGHRKYQAKAGEEKLSLPVVASTFLLWPTEI